MRYVCLDCDASFSEAEAGDRVEETRAELEDPELQFIEFICPGCGSSDIEDEENLENIRALRGHA